MDISKTRNYRESENLPLTTTSPSQQSNSNSSRRNFHVTDDKMHEAIQCAVAAASDYFSSLEEQENIPDSNKPGAYHVDISGRETPVEKFTKPSKQIKSTMGPTPSYTTFKK